MKIAIVGGGIFGVCAARSAVTRGHSAVLLEARTLGHREGSSHGRSRIIRKAYDDPFYVDIMREAYPLWKEIESKTRDKFVHETGIYYFGARASESLSQMRNSLTEAGVDVEERAGDQLGFQLEPSETGYVSADGGWVDADAALQAIWLDAESKGATLIRTEVGDLADLLRSYDRVLLVPGSHIVQWIPDRFLVRVQTVAYVRGVRSGPVWIEDGPNFLYGFPNAPSENSYKIGVHNRGIPWDLQGTRPEPDPISIELIRDFARRRFGNEAPVVDEVVTCLYTMTDDEDFSWGWLENRALYISACSGHGFKFALWFGERAIDVFEDRLTPSAFSRFCE